MMAPRSELKMNYFVYQKAVLKNFFDGDNGGG